MEIVLNALDFIVWGGREKPLHEGPPLFLSSTPTLLLPQEPPTTGKTLFFREVTEQATVWSLVLHLLQGGSNQHQPYT